MCRLPEKQKLMQAYVERNSQCISVATASLGIFVTLLAGKGNVRLAAEFNFFCDAEAARIVLEETQCPCQIVGWEVSGLQTKFSWVRKS